MGPLVIGAVALGALLLGPRVLGAAKRPSGPFGDMPPKPGPGKGSKGPPAGSKQTDAKKWDDYADTARNWWNLGRDVVGTFSGASRQNDTSKPTGTGGT